MSYQTKTLQEKVILRCTMYLVAEEEKILHLIRGTYVQPHEPQGETWIYFSSAYDKRVAFFSNYL